MQHKHARTLADKSPLSHIMNQYNFIPEIFFLVRKVIKNQSIGVYEMQASKKKSDVIRDAQELGLV
jgi:hypothetical protein